MSGWVDGRWMIDEGWMVEWVDGWVGGWREHPHRIRGKKDGIGGLGKVNWERDNS